ncbi:MAG: segregation/condensation protein A [Candidatus Micrarchaeales archaeon]|nr:segregation/condensation protein A [Candidatus Micrarchaeales archaeon]
MATTTTDVITIPASSSSQLRLEEFVKNVTWRELLYELVETNKLDPWDIDIVRVVDGYVSLVKQMKVMDLHLPANIILAAAILLRLKSDTLKIFELPKEEVPEELITTGPRILPDVPPLSPRLRLQPNRKITLAELMQALDEAMKLKEKKETYAEAIPEPMQFVIEKVDIDTKVENILALVKANVDKTGLTTFANLANTFNNSESILLELFIPLLFLAHKERVALAQEKFFDEIFVKVTA